MIDRIKEKLFGPKATLEFNLGDYIEETAFKRAMKSSDLASALFEIGYNLKRKCHRKSEVMGEVSNAVMIEYIFGEIIKEIEDKNINLEDLTE